MTAPDVQRLDRAALAAWPLPHPPREADKDARGSVLVIAGSREMPGAALLAATAALRAGGGKLKIATARSVAAHVGAAMPEARVMAFDETDAGGPSIDSAGTLAEQAGRCDAVLVGPGMLDAPAIVSLVEALLPTLAKSDAALVLDAAAMDAAPRCTGRVRFALTPHAGEMAHLSGIDKARVQAEAAATARSHAQRWQATLLLKGATSWLAEPDGRVWCHPNDAVGLATSGSGDVLAGLLTGLAARGAPLPQAAAWACVLHGEAGGALAQRHGTLGYLARELPHEVPALMHTLSKQ